MAFLQTYDAYNHQDYNYTGNKSKNIAGWPKIDLAPTDESMRLVNRVLDWGEAIGWRNALTYSELGYPQLTKENKNTFGLNTKQAGPYLVIDFFTDLGNFIIRFKKIAKTGEMTISGGVAYQKFRNLCQQYNIKFDEMAIANGEDYKQNIRKPLIDVDPLLLDCEIENAHHIDFHSAYPGALKETHPEFANLIDYLYDKRKEDETMKAVLNLSVGYFQSKWCVGVVNGQKVNYAHADLAADAINLARKKLEELTDRLNEEGRFILAHNTDGVWYTGEIYHGDGEGKECGCWENDHVNCTIRFKSKGAYEYIEDGKYHAVLRGRSSYESIKPREEWEWGDIYKASTVIAYTMENSRIVRKDIAEDSEELN